jgi:DNA-directed RNA polymerase specialized sigma24 family protein
VSHNSVPVMLNAFPATRWSLIARLPDQPQHVGVLLELYADTIGTYLAMKLRSERPERVQDVVQEVLLDLLGKPEVLSRAQPGEGSRFRYYLLNLAWRSALNAIRRERRRDVPSDGIASAAADDESLPVDHLASHLPAPDQRVIMDRAWAIGVVQQALDEVQRWAHGPEGDRVGHELLHATLLQGRSLRDAAATAGIPLASASRRVIAFRARLQTAITERLRLAGELASTDDPTQACTVLLDALRT